MKRWWPAAAVATALWVSGCGTVRNLTDCDGEGREAYGGVTRDIRSFADSVDHFVDKPPDHLIDHPGSGAGVLIVFGVLVVGAVGVVAGEATLTTVGDTLSLPFVPLLNRLDDSTTRPVSGQLPPAYPPTEPAPPLTPALSR